MLVLKKYGPKFVLAESPKGDIDDLNQTYITKHNYESKKITVFYNGQALHSPDDFEEISSNQFRLKYIFPHPGDEIRVAYEFYGY